MASCPLCGAEMIIDTCPRCMGAQLDGTAGPAPVVTPKEEEHGYLPAAAIFLAQGAASLLVAGTGGMPDVVGGATQVFIGLALLRGAGWARPLVVVGAVLQVALAVLFFALSKSYLAFYLALPPLCVLGAFHLTTNAQRVAAAVAGVALAVGWFALMSVRAGADGERDELAPYAVAGGRYSDPAVGLAVVAPPEITLYDLHEAQAMLQAQSGLLGSLVRPASGWAGSERLGARSAQGEIVAVIGTGSLPPHVASESLLAVLIGNQVRAERDDRLVPRGLIEAGLSAEVWRDPARRTLLARTPDGRMATVVCNVRKPGGERLCDALFAGLSLSAQKPKRP